VHAEARERTLAVTVIDMVRRWKEDEGDDHHDAPTLADLRRELLDRVQSEPMLVGTAGHKLLELAGAKRLSEVLVDGGLENTVGSFSELFKWDTEMPDPFEDEREEPSELAHGAYLRVPIEQNDGKVIEVELSIEIADLATVQLLPIAEQKIEKVYATPVGPVRVKGKIDGTDGVEVLDFKFTGKPDFEMLERTYQWRLYLDMAGAQRFRWEVFTLKKPLKSETAWRVSKVETLRQFAYPGMLEDVQRAVADAAVLIDRYVPEYWDRVRRAGEAAVAEGE
jgi:hypothetical protein